MTRVPDQLLEVPERHAAWDAALDVLDAGDVEALAELLERFPDLVTARAPSDKAPYNGYFYGATLLHHTAGNPSRGELPDNLLEEIGLLIDAGADVDAACGGGPDQPETYGSTALGLVVSGSQPFRQRLHEALVATLVENGARIDPHDDGGLLWGSLYHTVENRRQSEVGRLLVNRGHGLDLVFAACFGETAVVDRLWRSADPVAAGIDRYYRYHRRPTGSATRQELLQDVLLASAIHIQRDVAVWALEQGASLNELRSWGPETVTPLHGAAWAGWLPMVAWLLEQGADPIQLDPNHGSTALGWAVYCRRPEVADFLMEDDSNLGLMDATELIRVERVQTLLAGREPDAPATPSGSPGDLLRASAAGGSMALVQLFLARGADPSLANPDGMTAIELARQYGHLDVVRRLERAMSEGKG